MGTAGEALQPDLTNEIGEEASLKNLVLVREITFPEGSESVLISNGGCAILGRSHASSHADLKVLRGMA